MTQSKNIFNHSLLSGGSQHLIVLTNDNKCFSVGSKEYGQLGLGKIQQHAGSLSQIEALNKVKVIDVECGENNSYAITEDGSLIFWGMSYNDDLWKPKTLMGNASPIGEEMETTTTSEEPSKNEENLENETIKLRKKEPAKKKHLIIKIKPVSFFVILQIISSTFLNDICYFQKKKGSKSKKKEDSFNSGSEDELDKIEKVTPREKTNPRRAVRKASLKVKF